MTVLWSIISQLSYLITFAAGTVAAISIWSQKPLDRITFVMGTVLVVPAVLGMYIDELFFITNLWYIGWFGCNCLLLWQ